MIEPRARTELKTTLGVRGNLARKCKLLAEEATHEGGQKIYDTCCKRFHLLRSQPFGSRVAPLHVLDQRDSPRGQDKLSAGTRAHLSVRRKLAGGSGTWRAFAGRCSRAPANANTPSPAERPREVSKLN